MQLTQEQQQIIDSNATHIIINAFAGTGKTSTLVAYSKQYPKEKMLYLAYNKTMQLEARNKFPANVDCSTVHGLAFKTVGRLYLHKLKKTRMQTYIEYYKQPIGVIRYALDFLHSWFYSSVTNIKDIVPRVADPYIRELVSEVAQKIWIDMLDKTNLIINMEHDGYLKIFQTDTSTINYYKHVLLDEAQDSNPITIEIFKNKIKANRKVIVGDVHQAIYQFRGTTNALKTLQNDLTETFYITKSFRFGNEIAQLASQVLLHMKDETRTIIGNQLMRDVIIHVKDYKTAIKHTKNKSSYAILARVNSSLFDIAFLHLAKNEDYVPMFAGGIDRYDLITLEDLIKIASGRKPTQSFLANFTSISNVLAYAEEAGESELHGFCKLIQYYGATTVENNITKIKEIERIRNHEKTAILTTAHRSKGLEYDCVILYNDFNALGNMIEEIIADKISFSRTEYEQEANLLYVALTRAKSKLIIMKTHIFEWLHEANNNL